MQEPIRKQTDRGKSMKFTVEFDQKPDKPIDVVAYAFDNQGKLLALAAVKEGQVELPLDPANLRGLRLFFAPHLEDERKTPTLADMGRLKAYEPVWKFDPKAPIHQILPIPYEIWKWWLKCKCRVRGKVVKPVVVDGEIVDKAVCDAMVHICEVDKIWIPILRLPDQLVIKLRDDLVAELRKPPPHPVTDPEVVIPWPPPEPDPWRLFPTERMKEVGNLTPQPGLPGPGGRLEKVGFNPQPEPPAKSVFGSQGLVDLQTAPPGPGDRISRVAFNPQPEPPADWFRLRSARAGLNTRLLPPGASQLMQKIPSPLAKAASPAASQAAPLTAALEMLPLETRTSLLSSSPTTIRQALVANYKLILPYLCLWPWVHRYFCVCDELTTVITDHLGRFDTVITYPCFGDHPDVYFWVEYQLDGVWTTVYHPKPICCYTYWDYVCGSEATIHVTDPRVPWCEENPDLSGLNVVITTIGNGVSMSEIQSTAGATHGFTTDGEPFAGTLELRMDLSRSNLIDIGVTHYRWSYQRLTQGDGTTPASDTWHPMTYPVYRYYKTMVPNPTPPPALKPFYPADKMGPDPAFPSQNLFRIQPTNPPAPGIEWSFLNEHIDMAYAYFETASLYETDGVTPAAGQYEVKLELFNSSGALVNWSNPTGSATPTPIYPFMSSNPAPFVPPVGMTTVPAPAPNLITDSSGNVLGFKMVLYVDNTHCQAWIYDTWADTPTKAAGPCGFILFDDVNTSQAVLSCQARQTFNHAMFLFRVDKGSSGDIAAATVGWDYGSNAAIYVPVGSPAVNGYSRDASSNFSKNILVKNLLNANGFNCAQAAFAETLYVYATAVDGYQRAYWLDAWAMPKAFALAPGP